MPYPAHGAGGCFAFVFGCKDTGEKANVLPSDDFTVEQAQKWYSDFRESARIVG